MRGRLIFPFLAELHRLDSEAMADPARGGGYDPDFKEPRLVDRDRDGLDDRLRLEHPPVRVPCQLEPRQFEALHMTPSGDAPRTELALVFHFRDLERLGLVDPTSGSALIRVNDRLGALFDTSGRLVERYPNPPGLFVVEAQPRGFGLRRGASSRNLLLVRLRAKKRA